MLRVTSGYLEICSGIHYLPVTSDCAVFPTYAVANAIKANRRAPLLRASELN
jgi:hypothetical protein